MDWQILLSTFGLVFVAELGDKTQLAVMTQTCKFRRPWVVFIGGSLALVAVTALGAIGGKVLSAVVPYDVIRYIAAAGFVVMGVLIWREAHKKALEDAEACSLEEDACAADTRGWDWRVVWRDIQPFILCRIRGQDAVGGVGYCEQTTRCVGSFCGRGAGADFGHSPGGGGRTAVVPVNT